MAATSAALSDWSQKRGVDSACEGYLFFTVGSDQTAEVEGIGIAYVAEMDVSVFAEG